MAARCPDCGAEFVMGGCPACDVVLMDDGRVLRARKQHIDSIETMVAAERAQRSRWFRSSMYSFLRRSCSPTRSCCS